MYIYDYDEYQNKETVDGDYVELTGDIEDDYNALLAMEG